MSAAWSSWFDDVLPDVPGASQPLALFDIKRAAIEFLRRSRVVRARGFVTDPGGTAIRTVPSGLIPAGNKLVAIEAAKFDGRTLKPIGSELLFDLYGDWGTEVGTPVWTFRDRAAVMAGGYFLVPAPATASSTSLWLEVSMCPSEAATDVQDAVFEEFRDAIAAGAKWRLYARPKKPWTNLDLAAGYRTLFDRAIATAQAKAARGADRPALTTKPHAF